MVIPAILTVLIAAFGWRTGTVSIGMLGLATAAILLITLPSRAHHPAQEGHAIVISSMNVGSSSLARELFTPFDTGRFWSKSMADIIAFLNSVKVPAGKAA